MIWIPERDEMVWVERVKGKENEQKSKILPANSQEKGFNITFKIDFYVLVFGKCY